MSNNRELKEVKVQEIHEKMTKAKSAVVMDYRGLTVSEVTELRNRFRDSMSIITYTRIAWSNWRSKIPHTNP